LIVLLVGGILVIVDVSSNAGAVTHRPKICVFGHKPTGSAGTLFLLGIMVGVVALLEPSVPWPRAPRTTG